MFSTKVTRLLIVATLLVGLTGCDRDPESAKRLRDDSSGADWANYGRTFGQQHFSPLNAVNTQTVKQLSLAWHLDLPPGNSVSEPIAVDGVLYFVQGQAVVHAVDASSGKALWTYNPGVAAVAGQKMRYAWGSRGLAWWDGKIYVGTMDGRLIAIDAKTGSEVWSVMTIDPKGFNYITGAPRVFDGKVVIGFSGADVSRTRGYVTAYDAQTGKQIWRWFTVPGNPENGFENEAMAMAAKTWHGNWWEYGGGGTVWNAMSYDPETHSLIIGTGNGTPWNHKARSDGKGDNLFLASIVALDGDTGEYKWHYQINPGETWDYTATHDMAFADIEVEGKPRKVLVTAPKNGFFYVIDRLTGQLISAEPFAKVNWASKIDLKTGRPVENPQARYPGNSEFNIWPSSRGAHSWYPMAFSPVTGYAYIPMLEKSAVWSNFGLEGGAWKAMQPDGTGQTAAIEAFPPVDDPLDGTTKLLAWDIQAQKPVWSRPMPGPQAGGAMATAGGLVFSGSLDGTFNAYAADTGELEWSFKAGAPIIAPPITYEAKGIQYVSVLTGPGTSAALIGKPMEPYAQDYRAMERRVLTFALGGKGVLPEVAATQMPLPEDPSYTHQPERSQRGEMIYLSHCAVCHGYDVVSSGFAPDLRKSPLPLSEAAFESVVKQGLLEPNGMPKFAEFPLDQLEDLRQYIRSQADSLRQEQVSQETSAKGEHGASAL